MPSQNNALMLGLNYTPFDPIYYLPSKKTGCTGFYVGVD